MISVLTPTYNRSHTLRRLYRSLLEQKINNFEWVIIDDGSVDNTAELVSILKKENLLKIIYVKQDNLGKPQAINNGVKICQNEMILIVDSDDALTDDALDCVIKSFDDAICEKMNISGVAFRRSYFDGTIIGNGINKKNIDTYYYLHATDAGHLFNGDLAYCFKKIFLEKYPFPKFDDEKFVPELYIWNRITDNALVKYHTLKSIYYCDYLDDGLSKNFHIQIKKNPKGFSLYYKDQFLREKRILAKAKMLIRYLQCCIYEYLK